MHKLLVSIALLLAAVVTTAPKPAAALEDCYVVRATADARNEAVSRDRAKRRLQTYIGRKLNKFAGKSISPVSITCIRTACEASAAFCSH